MNPKELISEIAFELGFDAIGITPAEDLIISNAHFLKWRDKGYAGDMDYLLRENPINAKPKKILEEARSVVTLLVNYYTEVPPDPGPDYGRVASYAVGLDYHKVIKKKIKLFQEKVKEAVGDKFISKGFSDSVPLLEKSFARNSGHGFLGRHTLLINKPLGSYFFICEMISNLELEQTKPVTGTCGSCTRCMDICPTKAIVSEYELDARKCISYQTIENRNIIPEDIRSGLGSWMFGCDDCQVVCPYNKKAKEANWKEFHPESGAGHWLKLKGILSIRTEEEFHERFCRTPLTRPKRAGLIRNAAIVAGNRQSEEALPELIWLAENEKDTVLREHVLWALSQYDDKKAKTTFEKYSLATS